LQWNVQKLGVCDQIDQWKVLDLTEDPYERKDNGDQYS